MFIEIGNFHGSHSAVRKNSLFLTMRFYIYIYMQETNSFMHGVLLFAIKFVELFMIVQVGEFLQEFLIVADYNKLEIFLISRSQLDHSAKYYARLRRITYLFNRVILRISKKKIKHVLG